MTVKWNPKVGKFLRFFDENEEIQDCAANPNKPRELLSIITFILTLAFFICSFMLLFKTIDISSYFSELVFNSDDICHIMRIIHHFRKPFFFSLKRFFLTFNVGIL